MKVFIIDIDIDNCSFLISSGTSESYTPGYFDFGNLRQDWKGASLYCHNLKKNYANFNWLTGEALCFDDSTYNLIGNTLSSYGQLLSVDIERKGKAYIFNANHYLDCDHQSSSIYEKKFILQKKLVSEPIFKLKKMQFGPIFCTSGFFPEDQEFYHIYHKLNLTGLLFEEVKLV